MRCGDGGSRKLSVVRPRLGVSLLPLLAAAILASCGDGSEPAVSVAEIEAASDAVRDAGVPGVAVAITAPNDRCETDAGLCGRTASFSGGDVGPEDTLRIASVTKAFTGAVVLALVDEGALELEDTVADHLGRAVRGAGRITVADLLRHTSGVPDYTKSDSFLDAFVGGERIPWQDTIGFVAGNPPAFSPGSAYEYSDTDNILLALIAEEVAGEPFARLLERRVLQRRPALEATSLGTAPRRPLPSAQGYQFDPEAPAAEPAEVTTALDPLAAGPSGALVSTAADVLGFFAALRAGNYFDRRLLEQVDETVPGDSSPPGPTGEGTNASGLGIFRYETRCGPVWGHTGTFPGYRAFGAARPDGKGGAAVLVNASDLGTDAEAALLELQELASCAAIEGAR